MKFIMRLCAIVTGIVGLVSGVVILTLMAFELVATIGVPIGHIFAPNIFSLAYEGHLSIDYMYLVGWALGGILLFLFFYEVSK